MVRPFHEVFRGSCSRGGKAAAGELGLLVCAVALASACGNMATPSVVAPPVVPLPEPTPPNAAPVITSLTPGSPRSEAGQTVELVAVVEDKETPADKLIFEWSAPQGTFEGQGARVAWRAPATEPTPAVYTLKLTVIEKYTAILEDRTPADQENRTSAEVSIRVNDSPKEVKALALGFLDDFSNSNIPADRCVRNFSDSCRGKEDEFYDIEANRAHFIIVSTRFHIDDISFNSDRTQADIAAPCEFRSRERATGKEDTSRGTCLMTAVYEDWRWWLCDSHFSTTVDPLSMFAPRRSP